jgi:hypothetical protein
MRDETSSGPGSASVQGQRETDNDSSSSDLDDAVLIPLRPAASPQPKRTRRRPALSPLWSEIASVLARAQPFPNAVPTPDEGEGEDSETMAA